MKGMLLRTTTVLAVVALLFVSSLVKAPTTFRVEARTQIFEVRLGSTHRDVWYFDDARLYRDYQTPADGESPRFSGTIRVLPGATVTVTRIGAGALRLTCVSQDADGVVAEVSPGRGGDRETETVLDRLVIVDPDPGTVAGAPHPVVLPYSGTVRLGAEMTDAIGERPTLLLGGTVALLAHTLLGNQRYRAGTAELGLADYVNLDQAGDAFGVLVAGGSPDLATAFRVVARSLTIRRVGALDESVFASPLARLRHDFFVQGVWAGSVFLLGLLWRFGGKRKETKT